jgi:hypothetical protein
MASFDRKAFLSVPTGSSSLELSLQTNHYALTLGPSTHIFSYGASEECTLICMGNNDYGTKTTHRERFTPFFKNLSQGLKFAVEIRNKAWLDERFAEAPQYGEHAPAHRDAQYTVSPTQEIESENHKLFAA